MLALDDSNVEETEESSSEEEEAEDEQDQDEEKKPFEDDIHDELNDSDLFPLECVVPDFKKISEAPEIVEFLQVIEKYLI